MNPIGSFLSNDSAFGRLMTKCGTVIMLNILFAVSCIPFFTIGAAATALYYAVFEMLDAETPINPFKMYWQGLKESFLRSTMAWLAFVVIMVLGSVNLQICAQVGGWMQYLSTGVIAVMIVAVVVIVYLLPSLAVFPGKLIQMMKMAVCAAVSRPLRTLVVLTLHTVPLLLLYADEVNRPTYAFIGAFFGLALIACLIGKIVQPQFAPYLEAAEAQNVQDEAC